MKRVFVPVRVLGGLGLIAFGMVLGAVQVNDWNEGRRIRTLGVLIVVVAPILGVLAIARAFARGCSHCRKELADRAYAYPPTMYPFLSEQLRIGGATLDMFRRAPADQGSHISLLTLTVCPSCERIGAVKLEELIRGETSQVVQTTAERWLRPDEVWLVAALREGRPPAT